ncbi:hypothetical protein ACP4OV_025651 [Aristida adscensionis]
MADSELAAALVRAAILVLRKALTPFLGAWAASKGLGTNVQDLKKELLLVKVLLEHIAGKEIHNSALEELLQRLQDLAYNADDVLDELWTTSGSRTNSTAPPRPSTSTQKVVRTILPSMRATVPKPLARCLGLGGR